VDREIAVTLESTDVIHSFGVPKLAGHLDVIPGRTNRMWFNATQPGTYPGQCYELCGIGHARMRFDVIAHTQEDFDAWVAEQLRPPPPPVTG
jgi:cytochrome c oxidase subunit 2